MASADKTPPPRTLSDYLPWIFIVVAVGGIAWLVMNAAPEKRMSCTSGVQTSLYSFGTCTTN